MRNDVLNGPAQPSMSSLMSGILADVQQLIAQQMRLLRLEIREDLHKARSGAIFLAVGLGISLIGGLLFCFMLPYLLWWLTDLPLWACFGIFGFVFLLGGAGASYVAVQRFQDAASLPETTAALKENVTCLLRRN